MNIIKKLFTKHRKRGKPIVLALLTCVVLTGLAAGIVWMNDYLGVQANTEDGFDVLKAYDGEHLHEFVEEMERHFSADGDKGKYGLDLDEDGGFLQCTEYSCEERGLNGVKITKSMLKEKCNPADPKSPSRYWFWVKARNYDGGGAANECDDWIDEVGEVAIEPVTKEQMAAAQLASKVDKAFSVLSSFGLGNWRDGLSLLSSSLEVPRVEAGSYSTWHTEYYYTSIEKLKHQVNGKEDSKHCVRCPMANLKEGGIIADMGNTLSGNKKLSFYAVDILPFYEMMVKDDKWYEFTGDVFLHTVVGVKGASGHKSNIYKESEWESICGNWPSVSWELKQSYNQYLHITEEKINLQVYAVESKGDKVTEEEMEFRGEHQISDVLEVKKLDQETAIDFSSIKTFKDSDGKKYKLKGIRLQEQTETNKWDDAVIRQAFVAQEEKIFGTKKKTKEYSDKSHGKKTIKYDSITGAECVVKSRGQVKIKLNGDTFKEGDRKIVKNPNPNNLDTSKVIETPSGGITEKQLHEILTSATWKTGLHDTRVCLIYQGTNEPEVTLKTDVYDWDEGEYVSVSDENPEEAVLGKLSASGESSPFDLTSNMVKPKTGENSYGSAGSALEAIEQIANGALAEKMDALKDIYAEEHSCAGAKPNHYVGEISIEYTDSEGEEHSVAEGNAITEKLDYADPFLGEPVWNGTEEERGKIQEAIDALYKKVKAEDVSYEDTISIYVKFYQPITPVVKTYWYQMVHDNQKVLYKVYDSSEDAEAGIEYAHVSKASESLYEFDYPETLNIGRADDGGFKIDGVDAGPVKANDEETKAYAVKVKDHFKEEENEWDDHTPGSKELACKASKGSGKCATSFKGVNVAVIYTAKQPTLTVRIWKGQCAGDDSLNPPKDPCPDHGKEKVTWTKIDEIIETMTLLTQILQTRL